jgi:plastocyanin
MRAAVAGVVTVAMVLAVSLASVAPAAQQTSSVRGRVEIGVPITTARPASAYQSRAVPRPALAPASELRHVVVYLKDAPAAPVSPVSVAIRQEHENFLPRVVAVPIGSVVDFPNDDPIYHNVFSLSRAKAFNLGRYPKGKSKSQRFDTPGASRTSWSAAASRLSSACASVPRSRTADGSAPARIRSSPPIAMRLS